MRQWTHWAIYRPRMSRWPMRQDRAQAGELVRQMERITEENVELAYVDQGYTGETAEQAEAEHGVHLGVVEHAKAKRGLVLLPRS